jgi:homocysteine S-methyltransferase
MIPTSTSELLARMGDRLWLTDAGLETEMIYREGFDLPQFASFALLDSPIGRDRLAAYFDAFIEEAHHLGTGFILDTATWRATDGWGAVMGLTPARIAAINTDAVNFAKAIKKRHMASGTPVIINGVCGPHGDAYAPDRVLTADEAEAYWHPQIAALAAAGAEMISGITLSDPGQAIGIARAARAEGLPVVASFTVETDGRLISGMSLAEAIRVTDAATDGYPAWYMVNCAHPDHFRDELTGDWLGRVGGIRANASRKSHAELDVATELDDGDAADLAESYRGLQVLLPNLRVVGGCCGTGIQHVSAIGHACIPHSRVA